MDDISFQEGFQFATFAYEAMGYFQGQTVATRIDRLRAFLLSVAEGETSMMDSAADIIARIEREQGKALPEDLRKCVYRLNTGDLRRDSEGRRKESAKCILRLMGELT